jgi:hypothetical protein
MYAMLDHAKQSRALWGEAALTAAYLFNRSESRALPPGITPYEALHGLKPDLSHLRVFGARCFARIPAELQVKLGPHSREAVFMGYPPGVKAWRCRDKGTGTFFNSRDVIFDESFSSRPFPDDDSDEEQEEQAVPEPMHPGSTALPGQAPALPPQPASPPIAPPSAPSTGPRRSSRARPLTERGEVYRRSLTADRERLSRQRELRSARARGTSPVEDAEGAATVLPAPVSVVPTILPVVRPPSPPVDDVDSEDALCLDTVTVGFPTVQASLIVTEMAGVALRSDAHRNPLTPGYDMKVPPKTHDEAMRQSDQDLWLAAMRKEMNLMSEMSVYELVCLPAGRKAIGCRWVLEYKTDLKGGSVYIRKKGLSFFS